MARRTRRDGEIGESNVTDQELAHRHADPLVNEITIEQAFSVARG
jgi:hypothetical protein